MILIPARSTDMKIGGDFIFLFAARESGSDSRDVSAYLLSASCDRFESVFFFFGGGKENPQILKV